jgi:hypothetical protein
MLNAIKKKIPETTRIFMVVLGDSKLAPIVIAQDVAIKTKLPKHKIVLFSPL